MVKFLNDTLSNSPMSLHIPLHRTLSAILAKLVLLPWKDAKNGFLSSLDFRRSEKEVGSKSFVETWTFWISVLLWVDEL